MVFDIFAIIVLFPIAYVRRGIVGVASRSGEWVTKGRAAAIAYVAILFYALPFGVIWLTQDWQVAQFYQPTVPEEVEAVQQKNGVDKEDVEADDLDKIQQDAP
jgi:hypothetical protein